MALHRTGREPTAFELKAFADRLELALLRMTKERAAMTDDEKQNNAIRLLSMQQERMSDDIKEISRTLSRVADALSDLAVLEQKHTDSMDAIIRAHKRIDGLEVAWKLGEKEYTKKLQDIEIHLAKNVWIERVIGLIVAGVIALWVKGGL